MLAEFSQHPELRELLLATGEARLVEHREKDSDWGDGGDGRGRNMLGLLLMDVRQQMREGLA
ncbi:NADAR domain-containing protein [Thiorhodovibrio frisius]|uniref:NADAR domain-containing protein n=1 Tax=Thiorhodovibrio frisius TaxID=631362 RepID=UPI000300DD6D|nr:NADAR domain-containing protein [Thiorhodovibrio frisius]